MDANDYGNTGRRAFVPATLLGTVHDWTYRDPTPVAKEASVVDLTERNRDHAESAEQKLRAA